MKWYQIAGDWKQFEGMVKAKWARLTDGDLTTFGGKSQQLAVILQKRYGYAKDEADREIADFENEHTDPSISCRQARPLHLGGDLVG